MNNREIIKNSLLFPVRNYKQFAIMIILFLLAELIQEYILHHNKDPSILASLVVLILPLLALGINLQIIFHLIKKNRGFPELSLKKSLKEAIHDTLLESYYFILTFIITIIIAIPMGIFDNLPILNQLNSIMIEMEEMNVIQVIGVLPDLFVLEFPQKILILIFIFSITLTVLFSMCTLGKIDMEETHNFKQAFNLIHIFGLIKKIGFIKYLEILVLTNIVCIIVTNIVFLLNSPQLFGNFFSAFLEAFSLVFFLNSFALLYPD